MNVGKTLFAQVIEYVPWKTFGRIIERHAGVMAFSQLTWRESLRDIKICLRANQAKLFHTGLSGAPARSTLPDALNDRDWRIYHGLAMRLMVRVRELYAKDPLGIDLDVAVYALDAATIDLRLSLLDWAPFRSTKAAVTVHTLLDLRGAIPAFIHISDGKMGDVNVLDILPIEAGAFYVMDGGYLNFERLYKLHQAGAFFVIRAKRGMNARRVYSAPTDRPVDRRDLRSDDRVERLLCSQGLSRAFAAYPFQRLESGKTLVFLTNNTTLPPLILAALYKSRWQTELFFNWIKQHVRIKRFLGTSEDTVKTQIWCDVSTHVLIAIVKKALHLNASLYTLLQILSVSIFDNTQLTCALQPTANRTIAPPANNQLMLFDF